MFLKAPSDSSRTSCWGSLNLWIKMGTMPLDNRSLRVLASANMRFEIQAAAQARSVGFSDESYQLQYWNSYFRFCINSSILLFLRQAQLARLLVLVYRHWLG